MFYLFTSYFRFFTPASKGWGRYCFHRCVCSHPRGIPIQPIGGTSIQLMVGTLILPGGTLHSPVSQIGVLPCWYWMGYTLLGLDEGTPCQNWMGLPLLPLSGLDGGTLPPLPSGLDGILPPCQETEQHNKHLLHGEWYESFFHAGDFLVGG